MFEGHIDGKLFLFLFLWERRSWRKFRVNSFEDGEELIA